MTTPATPGAGRDPELAALLRGLDEPPALAEAEWAALSARVGAAAELPLARLRRRPRPFGALRARALLPLAAAAGIAGVALGLQRDRAPALTPEERAVVEAIVQESLPENLEGLISGEAAQGALLEAAVGS